MNSSIMVRFGLNFGSFRSGRNINYNDNLYPISDRRIKTKFELKKKSGPDNGSKTHFTQGLVMLNSMYLLVTKNKGRKRKSVV